MPTLGLIELLHESESHPPIRNHGYDSEFFQDIEILFDEIVKSDPDVGVRDKDKITSSLLQTGPCPGNARVYHQFASQPDIPNGEIKGLVGEDFEGTRRDAGELFESWVNDANEAVNYWLENDDKSVLEELEIPETIKSFYIQRLSKLEDEVSNFSIDKSNFEMNVQHIVDSDIFHDSKPDGAWLPSEVPGGVFESKLTPPPEPVDKHLLAGYAIQIERNQEIPVHFGVYLSLGDDLANPEIDKLRFDDVIRSRIKENIEKFTSLAFDSKAADEWDNDEHLSNRLIEPDEPKYAGPCRSCAYEYKCHEDGQYYELRDEIHNDISNLKLGGDQLLEVLKAISQETPQRESVSNQVMKLFPGKSKKSVFRGMVIPTLKRLHLIRVRSDGKRILLSPNAKNILRFEDPEDQKEALSTTVRDYIVFQLNITSDALRYFTDYRDKLSLNEYSNFGDSIRRFINQYIDYFEIDIPEKDDGRPELIDDLYYSSGGRLIRDESQRRELIQSALPPNDRIQYDFGRWHLLRELNKREVVASTWFVDQIIWIEWLSENRVIDLWEGSTYEDIRLMRAGKPFDAILLTEPGQTNQGE